MINDSLIADYSFHSLFSGGLPMKLLKGLTIMLILNLSLFALTSCQANTTDTASYEQISPEEAKTIMDTETDYVILDVRTADEYAEGHIPNAVNLFRL